VKITKKAERASKDVFSDFVFLKISTLDRGSMDNYWIVNIYFLSP